MVKATSLSKVYWAARYGCPIVASRVVLTAFRNCVSRGIFSEPGVLACILSHAHDHRIRSDALETSARRQGNRRTVGRSMVPAIRGGKAKRLKYPGSDEQIKTPYEDNSVQVEVLDGFHDGGGVRHGWDQQSLNTVTGNNKMMSR